MIARAPTLLLLALVAAPACDYQQTVAPHGDATTATATPDTAVAADTTVASDTSTPADTAAPADTTAAVDTVVSVDTAPTPHEVSIGPGEPVVVVPEPPPPVVPPGPTRPRRRMDVDQLDTALRQATGGIGWTRTTNGVEENLFVTLSGTLGKPDFITTTQEDLEPSSLLQKFLGEAARAACARLADEESQGLRPPVLMTRASGSDTWESAPAAIEDNLVVLLRRFHSSPLVPSDPGFERWRWLYRSAEHVADDPIVAWRTVCVGLVTHPDFWTY